MVSASTVDCSIQKKSGRLYTGTIHCNTNTIHCYKLDGVRMHITYEYQSTNYILITSNDKQPRVSLSKAEKGLVISEGWENEHNVIEPTTEGKTELVHEDCVFP